MPDWSKFLPTDFEYDFENDKLVHHGITFEGLWNVSFQHIRFGAINLTRIVTSLLAAQ